MRGQQEPPPKVSVIIPTYNRSWCIERAVNSVLTQSFRDFDLWIIDDESTDETSELIRRIAAEEHTLPVHYRRINHQGVSAARNTGVRLSSGRYLAFLDSDDEWMKEKLALQVPLLDEHPDAALVHAREQWIRNGKRVNIPKAYEKSAGWVYLQCLPLCMIGPSTVVIRREVFDEAGGFDESFPACEDYDLWLKITSRRPVVLCDEELIVKYGGHNQLSTQVPVLDSWRIKALCRSLEDLRTRADIRPDQGALSASLSQAVRASQVARASRDTRTNKEAAAEVGSAAADPSSGETYTDWIAATIREIRKKAAVVINGYRKHGRPEEAENLSRKIRTILGDAARAFSNRIE